ncbi:hypothetical protein ACIQUM_02805 [Amycolatopsis azurea]|uniref:hypothetical protein n=1 Tax=Amycolatopsis azurea TaxID=36819 RepID=UPI0037F41FFA
MSKRPGARSIARAGVVYFAAVAALTGVFATPAAADPAPTSPTAPASSAPATSEAPASSTAPVPSAPPVESSAPAAPKPQAERPVLEVSVDFEKGKYRTDEDVRFTLKVKNVSEVHAVDVKAAASLTDPTDLSVLSWGELDWGKGGIDIAPQAIVEVKVTGQIKGIDKDKAVVRGNLFDVSGFGVGGFYGEITVVKVAGHATGIVYGDKNGNGKPDDGEQLGGIPLTLRYAHGSVEYKATSGDDGKIDFGDVPAAKYYLGGSEGIKGWLFPFEVVQIGEATKDLAIRGVQPLNGALKASMSFTKDTYKPGELAHVTVKLSNSGSLPLVGIVAGCNRAGADFALKGGPGWGELAYLAGGATIAPGQTRSFDVTETVPDAALNHGRVAVGCDFGYSDVDLDNNPVATDEASVPGGSATLVGQVVHDSEPGKPSQGLADVKVVLASDGDCPTIVETMTDAEGYFKVADLVPGPKYRLFFAPPQGWRIKYENPIATYVVGPADNPARLRVDAEKGQEPPLTMPTRRPGCDASGTTTPAPGQQGSGGGQGGSGLASTGADVLGLGAFALAALGLGAVLLFGARRRRQPTE